MSIIRYGTYGQNGGEVALQVAYSELKKTIKDYKERIIEMRRQASTLEFNTKVYEDQVKDVVQTAEKLGLHLKLEDDEEDYQS